MSQFVHLHLHSGFSLLDRAIDHSTLAKTAAQKGMPAVAVTDHGNLFGAIGFYDAATKADVKPIIGCEMYVAKTSHLDRDPSAGRPHHLIVLCENQTGYKNLVKLVSKGYLDGFYYKPRIDKELFAAPSVGREPVDRTGSTKRNGSTCHGKRFAIRWKSSRRRKIPGKYLLTMKTFHHYTPPPSGQDCF